MLLELLTGEKSEHKLRQVYSDRVDWAKGKPSRTYVLLK